MPVCALYSSEKHEKEGNGCIVKYISVHDITKDKSLDDIIKELRDKQAIKNQIYNDSKKKESHKVAYPIINNNALIKHNDLIPLEEISINDINFLNMDYNDNSGNSVCLIGSSKSGKSTAMMGLFKKYFNNNKYISTLFSINSHIPIYKSSGDLIKVNKFINESEKMIKDMKKINMNSEPPNKWRFCILLDDIVDARYSRVLNALLLTYRNANFSSLISIQYPKLLSKSARCSANNLLFFSQNLQEGIETILRSFLGAEFSKLGVTKFNDQISLYRKLTNDHAFLYYHPMSQTLKRIKLKL